MIRKKSIGILSRKTSYDIWIGENLLKKKNKDLGLTLARKKIAIITDKNVHASQYSNLLNQIADLDIKPHLLLIEPGESSKSWDVLKKVLDWLTELNFDRTDYIIAFGGGVVGDIVSLAAQLFLEPPLHHAVLPRQRNNHDRPVRHERESQPNPHTPL